MNTAEITAFLAELIKEEMLSAFLLVEWVFMATGFVLFFFRGILQLRRVRGVLPAMQTNQMLEVGFPEILSRCVAGVMLMSIGVSTSIVANSLFIGSVGEVNVNTIADLTCVNGLIEGCFANDLGAFDSSNDGGMLVMQYFNILIMFSAILGLVTYGKGWIAFAEIFSPSPQRTPVRTAITQILLGAAMVHPQKIYYTFIG